MNNSFFLQILKIKKKIIYILSELSKKIMIKIKI